MTVQFSRRLAVVAGFTLPVIETFRRWHQLGDPKVWPFWLDDWVIGGFLLYGAWRTAPGRVGGQSTLAAAWGFACGLAYASFFSQVTQLDQPDPSGFPTSLVAVIKAIMFALAITALVIAMRSKAR